MIKYTAEKPFKAVRKLLGFDKTARSDSHKRVKGKTKLKINEELQMKQEYITKAKAAKSVEELIAPAKENGMEMTAEEAQAYFD